MPRKKKPPEHPNHERWLVSYADFITLMFAFFVVLFASSAIQPQKVDQFVGAVREAFDSYGIYLGVSQSRVVGPPDASGGKTVTITVNADATGGGGLRTTGQTNVESQGDKDFESTTDNESEDDSLPNEEQTSGNKPSATPTPMPSPTPGPEKEIVPGAGEGAPGMKTVFAALEQILAKELAEQKIEVKQEKRGIVISLREAGFFDSGSAELGLKSKEILNRIAQKLLALRSHYMIRVEGHTDNVPLRNTWRFKDNWELSSARANSVISYLIQQNGYSPERLVASGYGEWHPVASNADAAGRARNRRVDMVILNEEQAALEPPPAEKK